MLMSKMTTFVYGVRVCCPLSLTAFPIQHSSHAYTDFQMQKITSFSIMLVTMTHLRMTAVWGFSGSSLIKRRRSFMLWSPSSDRIQGENQASQMSQKLKFRGGRKVRFSIAPIILFGQRNYHAASTSSLPPVPKNSHRVVMMRHGESEFNNANVFTGWCDVALTPRGIVEAVEAGQVFASHSLSFRKCYTSLLTRSIITAQRTLEAAGASYTPIHFDWRLNERHYGALQGLGKERTADRLGRALVMEWRRSYHARPPLMTEEHPHFPIIYNDPRYRNIAKHTKLPLGESLEDCQHRVVEAWNHVLTDLSQTYQFDDPDSYSLIVAHANSLRALVMHLDEIPVNEIENLNIPTAIPFFYDISSVTGKVVDVAYDADGVATKPGSFRGIYITDESKKRNFVERRRAANDPFLWALHDHEVSSKMLFGTEDALSDVEPEGLDGLEEEAKRNTELFSSALKTINHSPSR
jgi:2,3-bisphosphoglycerate-dependent phosphoglycerate mutase